MMKFQAAIATGLGAFVLVPSALLGDQEVAALENALAETTRAIEVLAGIREQTLTQPETAFGLVASATEAPILDPMQRDDRLVALRNEVNLLQMELDTLDVASDQGIVGIAPPPGAPLQGIPIGPRASTELPTGMNETLRRALQGLGNQSPDKPRTEHTVPAVTKDDPKDLTAQALGYSADRLGEARASYHARRYRRALALLEPLDNDMQALYWKARTLEKLDRIDDAIQTLETVLLVDPEGYEAQRAKADLEFLRWKQSFLERMPGAKGKDS